MFTSPFRWTVAFTSVFLLSGSIWAADLPVVFEEDFSDSAALDRFVFASPDHWQRVAVGEHHALEHSHAKGYAPPHRSPHNIALIADYQFGSFVLEYDVQQTSREYGHRDSCVFFNFVDPGNFYYIHVATKSDPHAHQVFIVDDAPRKAITKQGTQGFEWGSVGEVHHVKVVRDLEEGLIQIFVNDMQTPIMHAIDKTHGWGYVGFGSFDDSGRVMNIRVQASEVKKSRAEFFRGK